MNVTIQKSIHLAQSRASSRPMLPGMPGARAFQAGLSGSIPHVNARYTQKTLKTSLERTNLSQRKGNVTAAAVAALAAAGK